MRKSTTELYSGIDGEVLSDTDFERAVNTANTIKNYPIYYVDNSGTVEEIHNTIIKFLQEEFVKGKWVVVFLDHVLLTNGKQNESERQTLVDLQKLFIKIKKKYTLTVIQISQLNRDIESAERIRNPQLHFPTRADLFGSDSIYQASDVVIVLHRPELFFITQYGVERWETKDKVFAHVIKNREGEPKILLFENHLKYNRLEEYSPYVENKNTNLNKEE